MLFTLDVVELFVLVILSVMAGFGIARRWPAAPPDAERIPGPSEEPPGMRERKDEYELRAMRPRLEKHSRLILQTFGPSMVRHPPIHFPALTDDDRIEYLKGAVRLAARRFGVKLERVFVRFTDAKNARHAGSIRMTNHGWFVDVQHRYRDDDEALTMIAAHEMAHYALLSHQVRVPDLDEEEEVTDTLVVLAGFGPLMLRVYHREFSGIVGDRLQSWVSGLGYLHPSAVAYLSMLQVEVAGLDPTNALDWRSPWYLEPVELRDELRKRVADRDGSACHVCGGSLCSPDPGCKSWVRCDLCEVMQLAPSANQKGT